MYLLIAMSGEVDEAVVQEVSMKDGSWDCILVRVQVPYPCLLDLV